MMTDNTDNIEQMLNSFIDGQLTERQQTEVKRLVEHDRKIARRLQRIRKCKALVSSLPNQPPPEDMAGQIKNSLERRALLSKRPGQFDRGSKHLLVRKVTAVAAAVLLVGILTAVIYTILAPRSETDEAFFAGDRQPVERLVETKIPPGTEMPAEADEPINAPLLFKPAVQEFFATIRLKTDSVTALDAFVRQVVEDNGLSGSLFCLKRQPQVKTHIIRCGSDKAIGLLSDLKDITGSFDSADMFIETGRQDEQQIAVGDISIEQIIDIVNQPNLQSSFAAAERIKVINATAGRLPAKEVFAAIGSQADNFISVPKPVMTSGEKRTFEEHKSSADGQRRINLTIIIDRLH